MSERRGMPDIVKRLRMCSDSNSQEAADEIERLREALWQIKQWAEAYPETVFKTPDLDRMRKVLTEAGMPTSLDAAHGTWGRHIAEGVGKIASEALSDA